MKQGNNKERSNEARECKFLEKQMVKLLAFIFLQMFKLATFIFLQMFKLASFIFKNVEQKLHVTIEQ